MKECCGNCRWAIMYNTKQNVAHCDFWYNDIDPNNNFVKDMNVFIDGWCKQWQKKEEV